MEPQDVEEGWVITVDQGRQWDETLYPTEEAAQTTAADCITGDYTIKRAKLISHFRPSSATTSKVVGEWIIED